MSVQNKETSVSKPRNLLLSVTGMSPAVVTETLYGIAQRQKKGIDSPWPDEIRIITTSKGKKEMVSRLVEGDWLSQVCEATGMPKIQMEDSHILVVPGANNQAVEDARSEEDHEKLADFITKTVRDFTRGDEWRIHASIAGGRKTMTFYLGYAMSLFGRHFDRMSHVLISEGFEFARGFYFPGQQPHRLETDRGVLDTREAEVTLADIPFIRMRHNLPNVLTDSVSGSTSLNYRELVDLINLGDNHDNLRLVVRFEQQALDLFDAARPGKSVATIQFKNPLHWAFYYQFLLDSKLFSGERQDYVRPPKEGVDQLGSASPDVLFKLTSSTLFDLLGVKHVGDDYRGTLLAVYSGEADVKKPDLLDELGDTKRTIAYFCNCKKKPKAELKELAKKGVYTNTLDIKGKPMSATVFDSFIQEIRIRLRDQLPDNLAEVLKPSLRDTNRDLDPDDDTEIEGSTNAYLIGVKPEQIEFVR